MSEIYPALAKVMADVDHVAKQDRNEHQRFMFRGVDAVVNAVGPALRKHGVIVVPIVDDATYTQVATSNNKPATACRVQVTYVFYATDGSHVSAKVAAEAWDHGDKAAPKAMSIAFRTALLQALSLPTDEAEPDSETYERAPQPKQEQPQAETGELMHKRTRGQLFALFTQKGIPEDRQLAGINYRVDGSYESRSEVTESDAQAVIEYLKTLPDAESAPPEEGETPARAQ